MTAMWLHGLTASVDAGDAVTPGVVTDCIRLRHQPLAPTGGFAAIDMRGVSHDSR